MTGDRHVVGSSSKHSKQSRRKSLKGAGDLQRMGGRGAMQRGKAVAGLEASDNEPELDTGTGWMPVENCDAKRQVV